MPSETTIHVAIELSVSSWLIAARPPGAEKPRLHHIEGGDTTALLALITELRTRASTKLGKPAEVVCCFVKQKEQTLGRSVCFGPRSLVCVDLPKARHSVSPAASGTASKIGGEGRFRRRSCSWRSSSRVRKSERSRLLS
jgi:hypothetical protein